MKNTLLFLIVLFALQSIKGQVPGTGIYYYSWHVTPNYKSIVNGIKEIPKTVHYTPMVLDFRVVRNPFFAELGITYIVVSKNKNNAKVLFLADSIAMQNTFQDRIALDSIFPNTLLSLRRNQKIGKWIKDETFFEGNGSIFENNETVYKYRFWQEDKNVTDCFSMQFLKSKMLDTEVAKDTLNFLTHQMQSNVFHYKTRLFYDEFKRHTDNFRFNFIDILPNTYKKSIPIYKDKKTNAPIVGYWDIDKYVCVEKKLPSNWMKIRVFYTKIIDKNAYSGKKKSTKLIEINGYINIIDNQNIQ